MTTPDLSELRTAVEAATSDDQRLQALLVLAERLRRIDSHEMEVLAGECLALAERLQDELGIATSLLLAGIACNRLGKYQRVLEYCNRAHELFQKQGELRRVAMAKQEIGRAYLNLEECASALEHWQSALALFVQLDRPRSIANTTEAIGEVYYQLRENAKALEHFHTALALCEEIGYRDGIAHVRGSIGQVYFDLGENTKALEQFQVALDLSEQLGDRADVAYATRHIGVIYRHLGENSRALEQMQSALVLEEQIGNPVSVASAMSGVAITYAELGEYEKAFEQMQSVITMYANMGSRSGVATATGNMGLMYRDIGENAKALEQLEVALDISEKIGDRMFVALITGNIGQIYSQKNFDGYDPARAETLLLHAIELTAEIGDKKTLYDCELWITDLYQDLENWKEAFRHERRGHELKEELLSVEAHKKAQQLEHLRQLGELEKRHAIAQETQRNKAEQLENELGNSTLQLLAQTELLRDLRNDLLKIARKIPASEPGARELRDRLKNLPCESVDWEKLDRQFKAVHPDFIRTLIERAPDLTATEVRICTMLRMNLKSNEIASLFCISDRGVEFHRMNIRQKLQLKKEEKLPLVLGAM